MTAQNGDYDELLGDAGNSRAAQFHPCGDERTVSLTVWGDGIDASRPGQQAAPGGPKYLSSTPDTTEQRRGLDIDQVMPIRLIGLEFQPRPDTSTKIKDFVVLGQFRSAGPHRTQKASPYRRSLYAYPSSHLC